jgi:CxxC motif-containing protein (DUF1111 family)
LFPFFHSFKMRRASTTAIVLGAYAFSIPVQAQTDPGPRSGAPSSGQILTGLSSTQNAFFAYGQQQFLRTEGVVSDGLGPRFNSNSCASCHLFPAVGGSSPKANPQMAFANSHNALPSFITATGPVREARFVLKSDGTADGGVHGLFTIMGQSGTPSSCQLTQDNFSDMSNIGLRIPTPTFGLGLVEAVPDATLTSNLAANSLSKLLLGISGRFNRSGNDGTITRFGWKAQNKSLQIFAGEAYAVEMGVTNVLFPNKRDDTAGCSPDGNLNDNFALGALGYAGYDDITAFAAFMRDLAPPVPAAPTIQSTHGQALFNAIGCNLCHSPSLVTGANNSQGAPFTNQTIAPYSDFALHHMGPGLADRISQGVAQGDEFRTAPLWGVGQRLFFLHDGRTSDLVAAIDAHASLGNGTFAASEANGSVLLYSVLLPSDKQALLVFLRSL